MRLFNKLFITITFITLNSASLAFTKPFSPHTDDCVVLLHGLARTSQAMNKLEKSLKNAGYHVANINYPSRQQKIEVLAIKAIEAGLQQCEKTGQNTIHFVTHSLGGILVRYYLQEYEIAHLGKVVMIAPPNQGSEVVDNWKIVPGFKWLNGPAGLQLGTDNNSIPLSLGKVNFPLGVIAGSKTFNPFLSLSLANPDDGKVSVEKTKVEGMKDFIVLPHTHTFIMQAPETLQQTLHFLTTSVFLHKN